MAICNASPTLYYGKYRQILKPVTSITSYVTKPRGAWDRLNMIIPVTVRSELTANLHGCSFFKKQFSDLQIHNGSFLLLFVGCCVGFLFVLFLLFISYYFIYLLVFVGFVFVFYFYFYFLVMFCCCLGVWVLGCFFYCCYCYL